MTLNEEVVGSVENYNIKHYNIKENGKGDILDIEVQRY